MKTVFPARESPVTPSRIVGEKRLVAESCRLSSAISASSANEVMRRIFCNLGGFANVNVPGSGYTRSDYIFRELIWEEIA